MCTNRIKKGFTLAELLIVVAIIGVLVAISIPIFVGSLDRAKEATCKANRRSLYGKIVMESMLSDKSYLELFNEYVDGAGKCPSGGTFSWEENGSTGGIKCSYHEDIIGSGSDSGSSSGSGSGSGSGSSPSFHGTVNAADRNSFTRGAVILDETGTCVIMQGTEAAWIAYSISGATVAQLTSQFTSDAILVDATDIKDSSFTGTLKAGDIFYDNVQNKYYYVNLVSLYESWPNSSWVHLLQ